MKSAPSKTSRSQRVREKLKGEIQGIDPGAGLTRLSQEAIKKYGLDYKLNISSEAAMPTTVDRANRSEGWFVATSWSPHWMFGKYKLRYIADPKGCARRCGAYRCGGAQGLQGGRSEGCSLALAKMSIPINELEGGDV